MYNKYISENPDAFSELYRPVEREESVREQGNGENGCRKKERFDLKRLLSGLDVEKIGILPLVLLLLLLLDVDDEEKIIIIALAVIFGI